MKGALAALEAEKARMAARAAAEKQRLLEKVRHLLCLAFHYCGHMSSVMACILFMLKWHTAMLLFQSGL